MPCAALPVSGSVASPFGWRWLNGRSDLHTGLDIGAPEGAPVYALLPGRVIVAAPAGQLSGYGNVIVIGHAPGLYSLYAHLSSVSVLEGQSIGTGAELGRVGRTAGTHEDPGKLFAQSGAHLHLELLDKWPPDGRDLNRLDPGQLLPAWGVLVPSTGPLQRMACADNVASLPSEGVRASRPSSSSSAAAGGAVLFLALAWLWGRKQKRRGV
jgi:murein DD-endopeptidase MepM/ murein hydrolase activator NlpD